MAKVTMKGKAISEAHSEALNKKIAALLTGQVLAVHMANTSTDESKVQVEFAEKINLSDRQQSALAMFNPGDDRFSSGARRTWLTGDRKTMEAMFGVSIQDDKAFVEIGKVLEPVMSKDAQGNVTSAFDFRISIREKLESELTPSQAEYIDNYIKVIPSTGANFIAHASGERVASTTDLVQVPRIQTATGFIKGEVQHVLIPGEYKVTSAADILGQGAVAKKELNKDVVI